MKIIVVEECANCPYGEEIGYYQEGLGDYVVDGCRHEKGPRLESFKNDCGIAQHKRENGIVVGSLPATGIHEKCPLEDWEDNRSQDQMGVIM